MFPGLDGASGTEMVRDFDCTFSMTWAAESQSTDTFPNPTWTTDSPPPLQATRSRTSSGAPLSKGVLVNPSLRLFPTAASPWFVGGPRTVCTASLRLAIPGSCGVGVWLVSAGTAAPVQLVVRRAASKPAAKARLRCMVVLDIAPREIIGRNVHCGVMRDQRARRYVRGSPHRHLIPVCAQSYGLSRCSSVGRRQGEPLVPCHALGKAPTDFGLCLGYDSANFE